MYAITFADNVHKIALDRGVLRFLGNADLLVQGPETRELVIDGGAQRIAEIISTVELSHLTLTNGLAANGSAIRNEGTLTFRHVTVRDNNANPNTIGGAVETHAGSLRVISSQFINNAGGALALWKGQLEVEDTVVEGNGANSVCAVYVGEQGDSQTTLTRVRIANNLGGGFCQSLSGLTGVTAQAHIVDSEILNNARYGVDVVRSKLALERVRVHQNKWTGINIYQSEVSLQESSVGQNVGFLTDAGGISNAGGVLSVTDSLIVANTSTDEGGGVLNEDGGTATFIRTTLTNNTAAVGGGVYNKSDSTCTFKYATLADNNAELGADVFNANTSDTSMQLRASIVGDALQGSKCFGKANSLGFNVIASNETCNLIGFNNDRIGVVPDLAELADNGGPTQTRALDCQSPAVDLIPLSECSEDGVRDQRGLKRPQGGGCDAGAFELSKVFLPLIEK